MTSTSDPPTAQDSPGRGVLAEIDVPLFRGAQRQGDVFVLPAPDEVGRDGPGDPTAIPADGVVILRGDGGGNAHRLVGDGTWTPSSRGLELGMLDVATEVYILHPEHGALGIAPGRYRIRRQREHSSAGSRMVAD